SAYVVARHDSNAVRAARTAASSWARLAAGACAKTLPVAGLITSSRPSPATRSPPIVSQKSVLGAVPASTCCALSAMERSPPEIGYVLEERGRAEHRQTPAACGGRADMK